MQKQLFIAAGDNQLVSPNAIVATGHDGSWYVSSVFTGVINEYDADGTFVRTVLQPPAGEGPGPKPFSTGYAARARRRRPTAPSTTRTSAS